METQVWLQVSLRTNIYFDKLEEISDLKIFPECFCGPLKTMWRVTCGPRAANCRTLERSAIFVVLPQSKNWWKRRGSKKTKAARLIQQQLPVSYNYDTKIKCNFWLNSLHSHPYIFMSVQCKSLPLPLQR